jgi:hypothetical protein
VRRQVGRAGDLVVGGRAGRRTTPRHVRASSRRVRSRSSSFRPVASAWTAPGNAPSIGCYNRRKRIAAVLNHLHSERDRLRDGPRTVDFTRGSPYCGNAAHAPPGALHAALTVPHGGHGPRHGAARNSRCRNRACSDRPRGGSLRLQGRQGRQPRQIASTAETRRSRT